MVQSSPPTDASAVDPFAAAAAAPDSPPAPQPRNRLLRWVVWGLVDLLALLLILAGALWWWAGSTGSLAVALDQVARWLPPGQTLQTSDVSGSVRAGGHIGQLRWQGADTTVELQQLDIGWRLRPLLQRQLVISTLKASSIRIEHQSPADAPPTEPLQSLTLPLQLEVPFEIDNLHWAGPPPLQLGALHGQYRYDGTQHQLRIDNVDIADGQYRGQMQLQGDAPMALTAQLQGSITSALPASDQPPLALTAQAQLHGTLAGHDARLTAQAQLQPTTDTPSIQGQSMQARLQAELAPWASQPLLAVQAQVQALDLARLWPGAPHTLLDGQLDAGPAASTWQLQAQLHNQQPGPWDRQQLPLRQLQAQASFDGSSWTIPAASLHIGQGRVDLQGQWSPSDAANATPWQLQAKLHQLSPARLHSQLAADPLSGQASARQDGGAIAFEVALQSPNRQPASKAVTARSLRLDQLVAKGRWQDQLLTLQQLALQANQAQLQGQLQLHTPSRATSGQLALQLPGAHAQLQGQLAAEQGNGTFALQLNDAASSQRWLASLPLGLGELGVTLQGKADLQGSWTGGWGSSQALLSQRPAPPGHPPALRLHATLQVPRLDITAAAPPSQAAKNNTGTRKGSAATPPAPANDTGSALQLRNLHAELNGQLSQAQLQLQGTASRDGQQLALQARAEGGLQGPGLWHAALTELKLEAQHPAWPGPWRAQLDQHLKLQLKTSADDSALQLQASAASATLQGPEPGDARLVWEPLTFSRSGPPEQAVHRLHSRGQLHNLPMAWAAMVASNASQSFRQLGLLGDMIFAGSWDIALDDNPRVRLKIARTSGDIQVQTGELPNPTVVTTSGPSIRPTPPVRRPTIGVPKSQTIAAGVRQAQLSLELQGPTVTAQLQWDSEQAGQIQAHASTQLTSQGGGWTWAPDAPLAGSIKARLPSVGAWSLMAPPGWRVQGTLQADAALAGTRSAPRWSGTLAADGLSLRSVVDGVDLRDGRLRAQLQGERLDITELRLHGGTGAVTRISGFSGNRDTATSTDDGGLLQGQGFVSWGEAASGIRMRLDAQARGLRVLVRADRQLNLSGDLQARLDAGQFTLRAKLRADRATIILPDESAPQLGKDVVVRSAAHPDPVGAVAAAKSASSVQARPQTALPPDVLVVFNLGDDFAVQGHGLTTRLTGELEIRNTATLGTPPRVTGEIRTDRGKFRAYGQRLDVETGVLRFSGAMDNPALDILALRPNISVRAGVQISGTAQSPRVRLFSDPAMPDAEKLSWVVLGHGTANGGAEAAILQQAALALLGRGGVGPGELATRLRLDEVGFRAPTDGETASGAVLTLGKRLSQNLYVTYESSLSGALGTLFIFYDLSQNLTLRAQTGARSAVDLIYTISFD